MGEKKPSTRIWKLEEEAREKGGSSEKLTKIKKKEEIYHGYTTYNGLSREFQDTSPAYHKKKKENKRVH